MGKQRLDDCQCYFLRAVDEFSLERVLLTRPNSRKIVTVELLLNDLSGDVFNSQFNRQAFVIACLILIQGDRAQRDLVRLWLSKRTRNIVNKNNLVSRMLVDGTKRFLKASDKDDKNGVGMNQDRLKEILSGTLTALKAELNFPADTPCRWSYTIDDQILAQLNHENGACRAFLERYRTAYGQVICSGPFQQLLKELRGRFPDDAETLIDLLTKTKSQNHLTAMSLTPQSGASDVIYVSLANACGNSLVLEDWKFVRLLEHQHEAHRIGELKNKGYREVDTPFAFNANLSGEVVAKFIPESSTLYVRCRDVVNHEVVDQAEFVLDIDYALCLYVTLTQLREDRERFNLLKEQADTTVVCDLFDNLPYSTCNRSEHE